MDGLPPPCLLQWIAYPSMLTTEDIVGDMCEGKFAD
jgi:hypothetical protein